MLLWFPNARLSSYVQLCHMIRIKLQKKLNKDRIMKRYKIYKVLLKLKTCKNVDCRKQMADKDNILSEIRRNKSEKIAHFILKFKMDHTTQMRIKCRVSNAN